MLKQGKLHLIVLIQGELERAHVAVTSSCRCVGYIREVFSKFPPTLHQFRDHCVFSQKLYHSMRSSKQPTRVCNIALGITTTLVFQSRDLVLMFHAYGIVDALIIKLDLSHWKTESNKYNRQHTINLFHMWGHWSLIHIEASAFIHIEVSSFIHIEDPALRYWMRSNKYHLALLAMLRRRSLYVLYIRHHCGLWFLWLGVIAHATLIWVGRVVRHLLAMLCVSTCCEGDDRCQGYETSLCCV